MTPEGLYLYFQGVSLVLGLLIGSFLNVVIARLPLDRSVVSPPSHCPTCGHGIRPYDNVPVLSWLILRGRCRDCKSPISSLYPTIELLTGLLGWLLFRRLIPGPDALDLPHAAGFLVMLVFVAMLVAETYIDLRHTIIPDELSICAAPFGIGAALLLGWLDYPAAVPWRQSVLGAFFGGGSLLAVMGLYWLVRRREGMGMGDAKLLAMIGAFLGLWPAVPFVIFVSSVIGAMVGVPVTLLRRGGLSLALPFGPFIAVAAVVYVLHGPELMERWFPGILYLMAQ